MPDNSEVLQAMSDTPPILDTIAQQQGAGIFETAQKQFPYLADKDIAYRFAPQAAADPSYQSETYRAEDIPDWAKGRQAAIEVYNPKVSPADLLAEYVSHVARFDDPRIAPLYQQFAQTFQTPEMQTRLRQDYQEEQPTEDGKPTPFETYIEMNRIPAYMRGYAFQQWPQDFATRVLSPQQQDYLNQIRSIVGYKPK